MKWMNCAGRKLDLHKFQLMRATSASGGAYLQLRRIKKVLDICTLLAVVGIRIAGGKRAFKFIHPS